MDRIHIKRCEESFWESYLKGMRKKCHQSLGFDRLPCCRLELEVQVRVMIMASWILITAGFSVPKNQLALMILHNFSNFFSSYQAVSPAKRYFFWFSLNCVMFWFNNIIDSSNCSFSSVLCCIDSKKGTRIISLKYKKPNQCCVLSWIRESIYSSSQKFTTKPHQNGALSWSKDSIHSCRRWFKKLNVLTYLS